MPLQGGADLGSSQVPHTDGAFLIPGRQQVPALEEGQACDLQRHTLSVGNNVASLESWFLSPVPLPARARCSSAGSRPASGSTVVQSSTGPVHQSMPRGTRRRMSICTAVVFPLQVPKRCQAEHHQQQRSRPSSSSSRSSSRGAAASRQRCGPAGGACRLPSAGPTGAAGGPRPRPGSGRWGATAPGPHLCGALQQDKSAVHNPLLEFRIRVQAR